VDHLLDDCLLIWSDRHETYGVVTFAVLQGLQLENCLQDNTPSAPSAVSTADATAMPASLDGAVAADLMSTSCSAKDTPAVLCSRLSYIVDQQRCHELASLHQALACANLRLAAAGLPQVAPSAMATEDWPQQVLELAKMLGMSVCWLFLTHALTRICLPLFGMPSSLHHHLQPFEQS